jgi:hypothetical protein
VGEVLGSDEIDDQSERWVRLALRDRPITHPGSCRFGNDRGDCEVGTDREQACPDYRRVRLASNDQGQIGARFDSFGNLPRLPSGSFGACDFWVSRRDRDARWVGFSRTPPYESGMQSCCQRTQEAQALHDHYRGFVGIRPENRPRAVRVLQRSDSQGQSVLRSA